MSDTSWEGYEAIPSLVMQGYAVLAAEALQELPFRPTHVFLQGGVGGFAAAFALWLGSERPRIVVVEPERAACLFASNLAGVLSSVPLGEPSIMAMLECYLPSLVAWRILSRLADAFMTVDDAAAVRAMRTLARPGGGDPHIVSGESGAAGLAGALTVAGDATLREASEVDRHSRVLVVSTEGATDPSRYRALLGDCEAAA